MNERIEKLHDQAFAETSYYAETMQRFAELIIATCTNICEDLGTEGDGQNCVDAINDYFKG